MRKTKFDYWAAIIMIILWLGAQGLVLFHGNFKPPRVDEPMGWIAPECGVVEFVPVEVGYCQGDGVMAEPVFYNGI